MSAPDDLARAYAAGEPRALAVARARAATVFARFVRRGVEPETLEHARGLPELAPGVERWIDARGALDADAAAADHQRVLGFEVPPLLSMVLEPEGHAGGEVTERLHERLAEAGVPPRPAAEGADHLAVLLDGLAFASAAEADAWLDGAPGWAEIPRAHARDIAEVHLGPAVAVLSEAVADERHPFFTGLFASIEALLEDLAETRPALPRGEGPSLPERLDDPEVGLREIAGHLLRAARSGLHLSRGALTRAGRAAGLPTGFGTREDRLLTLLRGAAENDRWADAVGALVARVDRALDFHRSHDRAAPRLEATRAGLLRVRDAARPEPD
jgi:nitrate reductase assembly molybdenum cofactor insertion protein NarJ